MPYYDLAFYLFAVIVIVSVGGVIFSRKMMYSAFSLLFTFFGVAGLYVLLTADFIAITQIMIYVGGILVLIIFGVMLTTKITDVEINHGSIGKLQFVAGGVVSLSVLYLLLKVFFTSDWFLAGAPETDQTLEKIGNVLMTEYLLPFEVAAVLLLIAFIGAALIARRHKFKN